MGLNHVALEKKPSNESVTFNITVIYDRAGFFEYTYTFLRFSAAGRGCEIRRGCDLNWFMLQPWNQGTEQPTMTTELFRVSHHSLIEQKKRRA